METQKLQHFFKEFISPTCNRLQFIQDYLKAGGLDSSIMSMQGKNHIYVKFPKNQYNPMFKIKTVIAHYDRIGIGANDNSAAVFWLMEWAISRMISATPVTTPTQVTTLTQVATSAPVATSTQIAASSLAATVTPVATSSSSPVATNSFHNIRLIFTDGEELGETGGVEEQGAFPLAKMFRKLGITNDDIYVFDCMGRGDVPILAQAKISPNVPTSFLTSYSQLEERTKKILQSVSNGKWFTLPVNYSDNASFIANGIPAVAITMLPSNEVQQVLKNEVPQTWKDLHTEQDNFESLTPQANEIFFKILNSLAQQKTLV